jgi:hypothetical protein
MSYTLTVQQENIAGCSIVSIPAGIATTATGPLSDNASFPIGTDITLVATVGPGKFFNNWAGSLAVGANAQTSQEIITFKLNGSYSIKATFSNIATENRDKFRQQPRDYVPNQGERADALHICQCPCACTGCDVSFTSALNRSRQTRALVSGDCCKAYPVGIVFTDGGSGYAQNDILQLQGGAPYDKPALFKVLSIIGGGLTGEINQLGLLYGQPYRVKPDNDVIIPYTGGGSGGDFAVIWAPCISPANLYRQ